jgi:hypothetical protein
MGEYNGEACAKEGDEVGLPRARYVFRQVYMLHLHG